MQPQPSGQECLENQHMLVISFLSSFSLSLSRSLFLSLSPCNNLQLFRLSFHFFSPHLLIVSLTISSELSGSAPLVSTIWADGGEAPSLIIVL